MSSLPTRNGAQGFSAAVVLGRPLPELLAVLEMRRGADLWFWALAELKQE